MLKKLLTFQTCTVNKAVLFVSVATFVGYGLAILRDNLLANFLNNVQADVYWAAFRIPDFVYGLLITGGVVAAFLPVFSQAFQNNQAQARRLFHNVFTVFGLFLVVLSVGLAILAPLIVNGIAPGFSLQQKAQTVALVRIMFFSPIALGVSAIFSSVLQYFNFFVAFSLAPLFYNLGIIIGLLFFFPKMGLSGLAWGVVLGAGMHLSIQIPPLWKMGFSPRLLIDFRSAALRKIFKLMTPRVLGSAAYQLNLIVLTALASTIAVGSIKIFNLSNNLYGVPASLIGIPFAAVIFPILSQHAAAGHEDKFLSALSPILRKIILCAAPISCLMFILRAQIIRILYGTQLTVSGYFGWQETRLTAASLGVFALSIFAACLIPLLARAFYALHDTKTPVKIALWSVGLNLFLSWSLIKLLTSQPIVANFFAWVFKLKGVDNLSILALPLALSLATIIQFFWLSSSLQRKINIAGQPLFNRFFVVKILLACLAMSLSAYIFLRIGATFLIVNTVLGISLQALLSALFS
ncbi:MAG: murein biosynthesis integral membrane protein MurJ, partial [Patescibacteria group bacterium]